MVMCWDEPNAGIGWKDEMTGQSGNMALVSPIPGYDISDADIVVNENGDCFIIYIVFNYLYIEHYFYDQPGNNLLFVQPFNIPTNFNPSNPNIDIGHNGEVVAVWEEGGDIFAIFRDPVTGFANQNIRLIASGGMYRDPDIAIYSHPWHNDKIVNITYIENSGITEQVDVMRGTYADLVNNNMANFSFFTRGMPANLPFESYGRPRIAANTIFDAQYDYTITVDFFDYANNRNRILGFNTNSLSGNVDFIVNDKPVKHLPSGQMIELDLFCGNYEPVVTYCGDYFIIAWVFDDHGCDPGIPNPVGVYTDILARQYNFDATLAYPTYSIVNHTLNWWQQNISVAGRFSPNNNALYTFYYNDNQSKDIMYKSSHFNNQALKKGKQLAPEPGKHPGLVLMNEPGTGKLILNALNANYYYYYICDMQGKIVTGRKLDSDDPSTLQVDISTMPAGLYILRLLSPSNPVSYKFVKE